LNSYGAAKRSNKEYRGKVPDEEEGRTFRTAPRGEKKRGRREVSTEDDKLPGG